ncbi:uncharacterized protein LOC133700672 isoform X8 [Populus nigra]|uniref:uncharacterized protein LOC133700672 isoform X8 n=1 Tax=Populus nigra TaxID=3691 RepID=UPI002B26966F|nr:uncharacterized protein LOC133700672 isoform X8 [Populus nigra]
MRPETENRKPVAVFMAFGTKGDVYPLSAIAAAFASDQKQYRVVLVTHSAHQNLSSHLEERHVTFLGINSPPVLSVRDNYGCSGSQELAFSQQKMIATREHRQECYSAVEGIFGHGPTMEGDFILINFFALEGWSLAELFHIRCVVAAPYVVPYSAPSSFESHFRREHPLLYKYLQEADSNQVSWKDVAHWMWPLFTENWGSWRSDDLYLSPCPFTDPVTELPTWHDRPPSPLLLYGFSKDIVECPDYWPSNVHVCGFWFLPTEWQFSCKKCQEISELSYPGDLRTKDEVCSAHVKLQYFLINPASTPPVFIGLSSIGSMGFLRNPQTFLQYGTLPMAISKMCSCNSSWGQWIHCCSTTRRHPTDKLDDVSIRMAAKVLSRAINDALSPNIKARALEIAERISLEDGVMEAVKILKQEMNCSC